MAKQPLHLLAKSGILTSFSISKKITEEEINTMVKSAQGKSQDEQEVLELVRLKIMQEIIEATQKGTLPGIILENSKRPIIPLQAIESLNRMVIVLSQKMKEKKFDKLALCYFINYLVGSLGLTEEDFEDFHRRLRNAKEGTEDEEDEEEGE